jgi:hypothetical protein
MVLVYLSEASFLKYGLELVGFSLEQIDRMCHQVQLDNFVLFFGSVPVVMEKMWIDLQTTKNKKARLEKGQEDPMKFLMAHYFLKKYPRDRETPATFQMNRVSEKAIGTSSTRFRLLQLKSFFGPKTGKRKERNSCSLLMECIFGLEKCRIPKTPTIRSTIRIKTSMLVFHTRLVSLCQRVRLFGFLGHGQLE